MPIDYNLPILIVDDYKTMRKILKNLLKRLGFEDIDEASDGDMALNKMRERKYGLVISDYNMESFTGLALLKKVRKDCIMKDTPFIIMVAESNKNDVNVLMEARVSNYIVKPFNSQLLKKNLVAIFGAF